RVGRPAHPPGTGTNDHPTAGPRASTAHPPPPGTSARAGTRGRRRGPRDPAGTPGTPCHDLSGARGQDARPGPAPVRGPGVVAPVAPRGRPGVRRGPPRRPLRLEAALTRSRQTTPGRRLGRGRGVD